MIEIRAAALTALIVSYSASPVYAQARVRPWIFREIEHFLQTGEHLPPPEVAEIHAVLLEHVNDLYAFYGEVTGVRVARKHISWYTRGLAGSSNFRATMNLLATPEAQMQAVNAYFEQAARADRHLRYVETDQDEQDEEEAALAPARMAA